MTFVEGVPPSKHFRCITQRHVLRSPITQPNIPGEQVAYRQFPRPSPLSRRRGSARLSKNLRTGISKIQKAMIVQNALPGYTGKGDFCCQFSLPTAAISASEETRHTSTTTCKYNELSKIPLELS